MTMTVEEEAKGLATAAGDLATKTARGDIPGSPAAGLVSAPRGVLSRRPRLINLHLTEEEARCGGDAWVVFGDSLIV